MDEIRKIVEEIDKTNAATEKAFEYLAERIGELPGVNRQQFGVQFWVGDEKYVARKDGITKEDHHGGLLRSIENVTPAEFTSALREMLEARLSRAQGDFKRVERLVESLGQE